MDKQTWQAEQDKALVEAMEAFINGIRSGQLKRGTMARARVQNVVYQHLQTANYPEPDDSER